MIVIDPFRIPMIIIPVMNWEKKKEYINLPEYTDAHLEQGVTVYTDFFDNYQSDTQPEYADRLFKALKPELEDFKCEKFLPEGPIQIPYAWFQTALKGNRHALHNHGQTGFSAVLYYDFDPEQHQATTFYCPFNHYNTGSEMSFTPRCNEGDLVIFPSYILHESQPHTSDKPRTIVSWNMLPTYDTPRILV